MPSEMMGNSGGYHPGIASFTTIGDVDAAEGLGSSMTTEKNIGLLTYCKHRRGKVQQHILPDAIQYYGVLWLAVIRRRVGSWVQHCWTAKTCLMFVVVGASNLPFLGSDAAIVRGKGCHRPRICQPPLGSWGYIVPGSKTIR